MISWAGNNQNRFTWKSNAILVNVLLKQKEVGGRVKACESLSV